MSLRIFIKFVRKPAFCNTPKFIFEQMRKFVEMRCPTENAFENINPFKYSFSVCAYLIILNIVNCTSILILVGKTFKIRPNEQLNK